VQEFRKKIQELFSEKTFQNYLSLLLVIFFIETKYAWMFSETIDLGKEKIFTKEL
jgi:hypothetical protein